MGTLGFQLTAFFCPFFFVLFFVIFLPKKSRKRREKEKMSSNIIAPEEEESSFDGSREKDAFDDEKNVFFSRAKDLRAMFEDSLSACFEPASVAVRFDIIFVLDSTV